MLPADSARVERKGDGLGDCDGSKALAIASGNALSHATARQHGSQTVTWHSPAFRIFASVTAPT